MNYRHDTFYYTNYYKYSNTRLILAGLVAESIASNLL